MRMPDRQQMADLIEAAPMRDALGANGREQLLEWLDAIRTRTPDPMLMKVLAGIGAWVASLFIVGFVGASAIFSGEWGWIISGLLLMGGSAPLMQNERSVFLRQMALAFALAGNLMVLAGVAFIGKDGDSDLLLRMCMVQAIIVAVSWEFLNHAAYRFVAAASFFALGAIWCFAEKHAVLIHLLLAAELAIAALIFLPTLARRYMPLVYAGVLAFLGTVGFIEFIQRSAWLSRNTAEIAETPISLMLIVALGTLLARLHANRQVSVIAAVVAFAPMALLGFVTTPGVLAAVLLLATAYASADRVLGVASALFLPWFLFHYYHALDVTLLQKSIVLLITGGVLLAACTALGWLAGKNAKETQA